MEVHRREKIQHSLRALVTSYQATMELMQKTLALLREELAPDPLPGGMAPPGEFLVDPGRLLVRFRGQVCFLGNSLPFKLLSYLGRRPNTYVDYEELMTEVWGYTVSDAAVRGMVKTLRGRLRQAGLADLAQAVDGSVYGRYALKLAPQ